MRQVRAAAIRGTGPAPGTVAYAAEAESAFCDKFLKHSRHMQDKLDAVHSDWKSGAGTPALKENLKWPVTRRRAK